MTDRQKPGAVRDAIIDYLRTQDGSPPVAEILSAVRKSLGAHVRRSSVQSYLNNNVGATFERTSRGRYRLTAR